MQRLTPIPQEYCEGRRRVLSNLCPRCHPCYNSKPHLICGTCFQETSALLPHCIAFCRIKLADLWLNVLTRVVAARASEEAMTELAGKEVRSLLAPPPSFANASSPFLPPPPFSPLPVQTPRLTSNLSMAASLSSCPTLLLQQSPPLTVQSSSPTRAL